jgi:hypothetical protein
MWLGFFNLSSYMYDVRISLVVWLFLRKRVTKFTLVKRLGSKPESSWWICDRHMPKAQP